jgi:hypothetical protein
MFSIVFWFINYSGVIIVYPISFRVRPANSVIIISVPVGSSTLPTPDINKHESNIVIIYLPSQWPDLLNQTLSNDLARLSRLITCIMHSLGMGETDDKERFPYFGRFFHRALFGNFCRPTEFQGSVLALSSRGTKSKTSGDLDPISLGALKLRPQPFA